MTARSPKRLPDATRSSIIAIASIVAILVFLYLIRTILIPFVFAAIIAYVCTPFVDRMAERARWPRWIFAIATVLILLAFAVLIGFLGVPPLLREGARMSGNLEEDIRRLIEQFVGTGSMTLLGQSVGAAQIAAYAANGLRDWLGASGHLLSIAAIGFAAIFGFILSWVLLAYLLISAKSVSEGLFWLIPPRNRPFVHRVWKDLNPILRRYFIGVALVVIYASIAAYLGLGIVLGLRHAVFLALVTGVFEVVPVVGPAASALLGGLAAVEENKGSWTVLGYIVYVIALRISIDEFFGPIVLGRAAYVQPVLVIFCFLCGAILFGVVGVVLAVPAALTVKATLAELYRDREAITGD